VYVAACGAHRWVRARDSYGIARSRIQAGGPEFAPFKV
jgi:hypothetical protein